MPQTENELRHDLKPIYGADNEQDVLHTANLAPLKGQRGGKDSYAQNSISACGEEKPLAQWTVYPARQPDAGHGPSPKIQPRADT